MLVQLYMLVGLYIVRSRIQTVEMLVGSYATLPDLLEALDKCHSLSDCEALVRHACCKAACRMPPASAVKGLWTLFDGE